MERDPRLPRGAQTLAQLQAQAGRPTPKYTPIVREVIPSTRDGWSIVVVSPSPGSTLHYLMPNSRYDPATIAAILATAPAIYEPTGLSADIYAQEQ